MKKGKLFVITGPSGVGKGTLLSKFLENNNDIKLSVSATTRKPRPNEINGVHYNFMQKEKFEELINQNQFLEWAKFADNYYGTYQKTVVKALEKGENILLEIELQGALQVKDKMPEAIMIFILPPSIEDLEKRLKGRDTEDIDTINKRISIAKREIEQSDKFNYKIINDKLDTALNQLREILNAEK